MNDSCLRVLGRLRFHHLGGVWLGLCGCLGGHDLLEQLLHGLCGEGSRWVAARLCGLQASELFDGGNDVALFGAIGDGVVEPTNGLGYV